MADWTEDYTDPEEEIRLRQQADRKRQTISDLLATARQGADEFVQRRTMPLQPARVVDDDLKAWLLARKMEPGAAKPGDPEDQPAPPEWGALAGMTRKEALRAGYGRAPKSEGPEEMAPAEWHDRLRKMGVPNPEGISRKFAERLMVADLGRQGQVEATIAGEERRTEREGPREARSDALKLRQEFMGNPLVKRSVEMSEANEKIQGTSANGPGDISMLVAYMKMVDPGSTVRENEFATAANAGGVPDKVRNQYNRLLEGDLLPENLRKQFRAESANMLKAQLRRYNSLANEYREIAKRSGLEERDVVLRLGMVEDRKFVNGRVYEKVDGQWYDIGPEIR